MIYIADNKLSIDGIDIYPDHKNNKQFWYIPGKIQLAERNGKKELSYMWYTDSVTDNDGSGFLNFEVNTAVPTTTLDKIKGVIAKAYGLDASIINLSPVPYTNGNVNFSILGPIAKQADSEKLKEDSSVLRVSKEQLVWSAGSSSLVGDNSAVCSVKFTKEGKLAAAMKQSILKGSNSIAAIYSLEFLAMRPSVTFTVEGTLEKTIKDFQISIGAQIPLEAFILDLGIQAQWKRIMEKTDLIIKVENYTGEEGKGEEWARQIILDYVLKNFFEVQIANEGKFLPLPEAPKVDEAVQKAKNVEQVAGEKAEEDGKEGEEKTSAVKDAVSAASSFIPKVNIRAAYYDGKQTNSIDFMYTEMKATIYPAIPQSLVLEGLENPEDYILEVNRAQDPFGLPYPVPISIPGEEVRKELGLQAINIGGKYPAQAPPNKQMNPHYSILDKQVTGENPFPFQRDGSGSADVEYSVDYVFKAREGWDAEKTQYNQKGTTDRGMIVAMPESILDFLKLNIQLKSDFVWDEADQVVVTLTSAKWQKEKRIVFNKGGEQSQDLKFRYDIEFKDEPISYEVKLMSAGSSIHKYGPETVLAAIITIRDRFVKHIPINFKPNFNYDNADIFCSYEDEDNDFYWDTQFTLEKEKPYQLIVPALKDFKNPGDLIISYEVTPGKGEAYSGKVKGGRTVRIDDPTE